MTTIVVVVADGHSNSKVGLYNPALLIGGTRPHDPSVFQRKLWNECWLPFWERVAWHKKKHRAKVVVILNGDWIDYIMSHPAGLICLKRSDILALAASVLEPALEVCDQAFMIKGTPRHTGTQGELEELLAKDITIAEPDPDAGTMAWYYLKAEFEGVLIDATHHPSTSSRRPWTRAQAVAREGAVVRARYLENGERVPDAAFRGHVHWHAVGGPDPKPQMFFCHPWQLTTDYGYRIGYGTFFEPPGGYILICKDGQYELDIMTYKAKERGVWHQPKKSLLQKLRR